MIMKKIIILLISIFILPISCFANNCKHFNKTQKVAEQQDWMQGEEKLKLGNPNEFIDLYIKRRIDGKDIPRDIKIFATDNNCFKVMKSYHWSSPIYNYGNVYMCGSNGKIKYIIEKNGNIKFANWFLKRKFNVPIYE